MKESVINELMLVSPSRDSDCTGVEHEDLSARW